MANENKITQLRSPMLLELSSERAYEAIGALTLAGFRVMATSHGNRFRIIDGPNTRPPVINDFRALKPKKQRWP